MAHVAVIDKDPAMLGIAATLSRQAGHAIYPYSAIPEALAKRREDEWQLAVVDLGMTGADREDLRRICAESPVVLTWQDDPAEGWKDILAACPYGYLRKPYQPDHLARLLANLLEHYDLKKEVTDARVQLRRRFGLKRIVGNHPGIQRVIGLVERVADSAANVLITGASGTGKSLLARVIHQNSPWSDGEYLAIDCAGIEENQFREIIQARLRQCRDQGAGTTFYLENVAVLSRSLQDWLAQVIVDLPGGGGLGPVEEPACLRFIGSSRLTLSFDADNQHFSRDLYCCLAQVQMDLPPLTDRPEDIPLLVKHFLRGRRSAATHNPGPANPGSGALGVAPTVMRLLQKHDWPDNVRELRHVIDQAATICNGDVIEIQDLPRNLISSNGDSPASMALELDSGKTLNEITREFEKQCIRTMIDRCLGNREEAARSLGISLATLYRKLDLKEKRRTNN